MNVHGIPDPGAGRIPSNLLVLGAVGFWGVILFGLLGCSEGLRVDGASFSPPPPARIVSYEVSLEGLPSAPVVDLAKRMLLTFRLRERGARSRVGLLQRVKNDETRLTGLLRSQGYFAPDVTSGVVFRSDEAASVAFVVRPGPLYVLNDHALVFHPPTLADPPKLTAESLGSPVGAAANAAAIVRAEEAAVAALQAEGYPYATYVRREGVADPESATVTVVSSFALGPFSVFGPIRFAGLETVQERYLSTYWSWKEGSPFDRRALREYQQRLMSTGLFRHISVRIPDEVPPDSDGPSALPVLVTVDEGPRRRVEAGMRYDTDLGPAARFGWQHRNLFGANESLKFRVDVGRATQGVTSELRKPQYIRPGQDLVGSLGVTRTDDPAFDARAVNGAVALKRRLTPRWIVGFGGLVELSDIRESRGSTNAHLAGFPASISYDRTDHALNPTTGERLELEVTPFAGQFDGKPTRFANFGIRGAAYRSLDRGARYVGAARARIATVAARSLDRVPATRRLYAGGGGSVRGYAKSSIGPRDPDGVPSGGRAAVEAEAELRIRVDDDFGIVPFVAAGLVSADSLPDGSDDVRAALGLGMRYFSGVGPIRVDLAVPVNARSFDDPFAFYVSIGQAF